jgi:hypothetical protein
LQAHAISFGLVQVLVNYKKMPGEQIWRQLCAFFNSRRAVYLLQGSACNCIMFYVFC